jgi:KDO2-lipid IV(A) lauroyltransferase
MPRDREAAARATEPARRAGPTAGQRLAFAPLRALRWTLERVPPSLALRFGDVVGTLMHALLWNRVRLARRQLGRSLGLDPESEAVRADVRRCFRHFARVPVELVTVPRVLRSRRPEEVLHFVHRERLDEVLARGRGAIGLTGHFGNWELLGALAPLVGLPVAAVARPLENELADAELQRLRGRFGQRVVVKDVAALPLARELKRGGLVAMVMDQHAGSRGVRIPFFGEDASTFTLAASLARRFDTVLLPIFARVVGPHRVEAVVDPPIAPDPALSLEEDCYRMTRAFHRRLEAAIRACPSQYLWFHRRWKRGGQEPDPRWRERYAAAE